MAFGFGLNRFANGLSGRGGFIQTIKFLLTNVLNLTATIGPSAVAGGTSGTWIEVFDATLGKVLELFPAGTATSPGQRGSYDTDEGATPGDEKVINGDASDTTYTDSSVHALVGFSNSGTHNATNKVTIENGAFRLISDGTFTGVTMSGAGTPTIVGRTYAYSLPISSISGSIKLTNGSVNVQFTTAETHTGSFVADSTTTNIQRTAGACDAVYDDFSLKEITPTFTNSVSKADSTLLHPVKTGANGEDIFLVHQAWPGAAQAVDANSYAVGKNGNHWYYFQADSGGGTTGGSEPTWPNTLDATVVDNDITWTNKGRYSNIGPGYLPHVLSIQTEQTQYLLNSDAPATQTTGSLANGDYVLWQNGAGSSDLTAGTATISTTGSATDGSPLTFSVTSPGTVTVTIVGGPPDEFQLENGDFPTVFILSAGSTVVRDADNFSSAAVPETGKDRWRLALENLGAQTIVSDGTNTLSYSGTAVEFTDGAATLSHIVVPVHGDFVGLDEETGTLYYNGSSVDVDGSLAVTWGAITDMNNVVDITDDSALKLTDISWSQP